MQDVQLEEKNLDIFKRKEVLVPVSVPTLIVTIRSVIRSIDHKFELGANIMTVIDIRDAELTDISSFLEFQREGWFEDYEDFIPEGYAEYAMGLWGTKEAIQKDIEGDTIYLVAEHKGMAVACASASMLDNGEAELWWIHTKKSHRGQGIGRTLVEEVIKKLRHKVPSLFVTTFQGYTPTLNFYSRLGFQEYKTYITETGPYKIPDIRLVKAIE